VYSPAEPAYLYGGGDCFGREEPKKQKKKRAKALENADKQAREGL